MLMQTRDVEAGGQMSYFADHRVLGFGFTMPPSRCSRSKATRPPSSSITTSPASAIA